MFAQLICFKNRPSLVTEVCRGGEGLDLYQAMWTDRLRAGDRLRTLVDSVIGVRDSHRIN